jgi:hypothetical protein
MHWGASVLMLVPLMVGSRVRAAAPALPPDAVGPDTTVVVHMDAANLTPDAMRQAAGSALGNQSPSRQQIEQQIAKFQEKYEQAIKAGVLSITMVATTHEMTGANPEVPGPGHNPGAEGSAKSQGFVYVQLKPGANASDVQRMISDNMEPEEREKAAFDHQGNFLIVHEKGQQPPSRPDPARAKQFSDALGRTGNAAFVVAFVPDAAIRDQARQQANNAQGPRELQDAMPVLANSRWATVAINLGNSPGLVITDETADANSATKLTTAINSALAQLKQMAQGAQNGQGGPMAMFAPMLAPLADALKPVQNGSTVTVSLSGPALSMVANTVAQFAPMLGMGRGGPGGPGRGPGARPGRRPPPPAGE